MKQVVDVCCDLMSVSSPFNDAAWVEIRFAIPPCGTVVGGGELAFRIRASDAEDWMTGEKFFMHLRN